MRRPTVLGGAHPNPSRAMQGAVIGLVTNNHDPDNVGRVKVRYPWLDDQVESPWARVICFYAGPDRGGYIIPEVGDEVLLMFEHGDPAQPFIIGSLWNGVDKVPGPGNPDGENNTKWWQSRCGHKLIFEDKEGAESITLVDKSGRLKINIDVPKDLITIEATTGDLFFLAPKGPVNIECNTMEITASKSTTVKVGDTHNEVSKDRVETIGANCDATAKELWQIGTKTLSVTFGSAKIENNTGVMVVEKTSTQTIGTSSFEGHTVHRNTGPETLTAGTLEIHAKHFELMLSGPATMTTGVHKAQSDADAAVQSTAILTVMGGMVSYDGGSNLSNLASLVTLC